MHRLRSQVLRVNPELNLGVRFWALWFVAHTGLLAAAAYALPPVRHEAPILVMIGYPLVIGAVQSVLLWPLAAGPARPRIVAGLAVIYFAMTPAIYQVVVFAVFMVAMGVSAPGSPILDLLLITLSAGGGLLAGAVVCWTLSPRWDGSARLVWLHTALAMLVTVTLDVALVDVLGWRPGISQEVVIARTLAGGALGLGVAAATGAMLLRLTARTDTAPAADSLPEGYRPLAAVAPPDAALASEPAPPARPVIAEPLTQFEVSLWIGGHIALLAALNVVIASAPISPLFAAVGYGPTVGLLQAAILRVQYDPGSSALRSWLLPTTLWPVVGAFLAIIISAALSPAARALGAPPVFGRGPAGFPTIHLTPALYLPALGAGLAIGLLHWRRLRLYHRRGAWRTAVYLLAHAVAPALAAGMSAGIAWQLGSGNQSFRSLLATTTVPTVFGAAVAGLAVALMVGWATLQLVRHTGEP